MGVAKRKEDRRLMMFEDAYSVWAEKRLILTDSSVVSHNQQSSPK